MPRTKGAKNKTHKAPRKTIAVRLTAAELETLATIHPSPGKAIHALIAQTPRK